MSNNRANWDPATAKIFLDLCIAEKNQMNYNKMGLSRLGWQHMYCNFKELTGLNYGNKQIQNKLTTMRRAFVNWRGPSNLE
jgi:hypothetical protein